MIVHQPDPAELLDRRMQLNFLAKELRPELYCFV
jgi:hypothetical protein